MSLGPDWPPVHLRLFLVLSASVYPDVSPVRLWLSEGQQPRMLNSGVCANEQEAWRMRTSTPLTLDLLVEGTVAGDCLNGGSASSNL